MRKEFGKPTRDLFFGRLKEIAPDFVKSSEHDIKGFTWTVARRIGDLRQAITFQRHKYDDAFTVEISWSCLHDNPVEAKFGEPSDAFTPRGLRFRLGRFWEPQKDVWWYVAEPQFGLGLSHLLKTFVPAPDPEQAIHAAVADAMNRIEQHALPYLDRVAQAMSA